MNQNFDVLILGGGIIGLTAALAMAQKGFSTAIIDAGTLIIDSSSQDLRVYAINKSSELLLRQLNVWQDLEAKRLSPYKQMHVWDAANKAFIDFDSRYIAQPYLGTIVEENQLKKALINQLSAQTNVHFFSQCVVEELLNFDQGIRVRANDKNIDGQLLMIADGANSTARNKLNVKLTTWSYNQHALIATINTEKPHQETAYQVFNPDGPLAFLPLASPNQCSIVWSSHPNRIKSLMDLSEEEFNVELTKAFDNRLGKTTLASNRHYFPLAMRHVKQYVGERWLLLGDAAHTIHPLAGLGLNVGLADVKEWMDGLNRINQPFYSKRILDAYQRNRKHSVWQIILLMEGFKQLFAQTNMPVTALRGLGIKACNQLVTIKRLFIQHAQGKL